MDTGGNQIGLAPLTLDRSVDGHGQVRLRVAGELDSSNVDRLREMVGRILAEPGLTGLVLDVAALEFIVSSGVGVLVRARQEADSRGVSLTLVNACGTVRQVLAILGVHEFLTATRHQSRPNSDPELRRG